MSCNLRIDVHIGLYGVSDTTIRLTIRNHDL